MHLVIDGYGEDPARFGDEEFVRRFLDACPDQMGMTKISQPFVLTYHSPRPEDWGVSGFVLIAESHISVHTFPARNYVNIDLFSCKPFDVQGALGYVRRAFGLVALRWRALERGLETYDPLQAREAGALARPLPGR